MWFPCRLLGMERAFLWARLRNSLKPTHEGLDMIKSSTRVMLVAAMLAMAVPASNGPAKSEQWPNQPIMWVIPFPAGGSSDSIARPLSFQLEKQLHQRIIIENKGGAGGTIGAAFAAKAAPNGYTFLLGAAHHAIAESLYPNLSYNLQKDFIPIAAIARPPHVVVVNPEKVKAKTLGELISFAKANPGTLNFASAGQGTTLHLAAELFQNLTGTKLNHIPYRGNGPAMKDLIAGHVDLMFDNLTSSSVQINEGKVRALAVAHPTRVSSIPGVPTAKEAGLEGFEVTTWYALLAVKGTPDHIVERMKKEIVAALKTDEIKSAWERNGSDVPMMAGPELAAFVSNEVARWGGVVRRQMVKAD